MKFVKHGFQLGAVAAALLLTGNAFAATVNVTGLNPSGATDTSNTVGGTTAAGATGNFSVSRYNGTDILTGLSFSAVSGTSLSNNLSLSLTKSATNVSGSGNMAISVALGGGTATATSNNASVTAATANTSNQNVTYSTNTGNVSAVNLANFYGPGAAQTGSLTETLRADKTGGTANATLNVNNNGNHSAVVTYTYSTQAHANGALDALGSNILNLSFGHIAGGATPAPLTFDLYNTLGSYGLQVIGITQTDGAGVFSLGGLGGVSNLAGGSTQQGSISMAAQNPSVFTNYTGSWQIQVADSAAGVGAGKNTSGIETLTVNVTAAVPEPESYAMLLAGLGAMGFMGRRRNRASKA